MLQRPGHCGRQEGIRWASLKRPVNQSDRPQVKKKGVLSQKEFSRWEDDHHQKIRKEGDDEREALGRVQRCLSLAVKGAVCLLTGISGICAWPFFCTFSTSVSLHNLFAVPFFVLILIGTIILIMAGIKFLSPAEE
jgi:hypothetical protein